MAETTLACVQMDCEIGNVEANRSKITSRIREASARGAEIVIFPECALTGYCFDSLEEASQYAESLDGPSAEAFSETCRETGAHAVIGFIEKGGAALYNSALVVGPDGPLGTYRKAHLPFLGVDRFLTSSERPFSTFDLPSARIGINICYDVSFPEASRVLKLLGAELIILPTNWPGGAWRTPEFVINTRAMENHVNFAAVNRVGIERGWRFIGRSMVVDYNGDRIAEAGSADEETLIVRVDIEGSNRNRIVNVAGAYEIDRMADRRPDLYSNIASKAIRSSSAG